MTDDEKLAALEAHHKLKFEGRPKPEVIHQLYADMLKFNAQVLKIVDKDPSVVEKMERSLLLKKVQRKKPRLTVVKSDAPQA